MSANIFNVQNLSKVVGSAEGKSTILHDLSLDLVHGDSLTIVGSPGSGKSTLLGLLVGLGQPSGGEVRLIGRALDDLDEDRRACVRAAHIGFVFQSFQLLNSLDVLESVVLPLEPEGRVDVHQRARELLGWVGLGQCLGHRPRQLSGGEQQWVAIARVFVARPDVLFADEPTGNLDSATGERVSDLFFELNREHGTILALVTHDERLAYRCRCLIRPESGCLIDRIEL